MSQKKKEIYHCDRCGELFRAPVTSAERVICNVCGNPPIRAIRSNLDSEQFAASEEDIEREENSRRSGRDVADFVTHQKVRRARQMKIGFGIWVLLLLLGGASAIYYKGKQEDIAAKEEKQRKERDYEKMMYRQRQIEALKRTRPVINGFVYSPDNNSRSIFVMDGVNQLIPMKSYYDSHPGLSVEGELRVVAYYLNEDVKYPRLDTLMEDGGGKRMEAVFWMKDGKWRIDWAQLVRYSEKSWNRFLLEKRVGSQGRFRLYVRRPAVKDKEVEDTLLLMFYDPKVFDGGRGIESPQVEVNPFTKMGKALIQAIEKAGEMKGREECLGVFDPPGWARVNVELAFEEEDGKPVLKVKKLYAVHWLTVLEGEIGVDEKGDDVKAAEVEE